MNRQIKLLVTSFLLSTIVILGIIPAIPTMADDFNSVYGWDQLAVDTVVILDNGGTANLSEGEGVTILGYNSSMAHIEYSSASQGYLRGCIALDNLQYKGHFSGTDVGMVKTNSPTYYNPDFIYPAGSVNSGETVAILSGTFDTTYYIEYNVSKGQRKRAFVSGSSITPLNGNCRKRHYHLTPLIDTSYLVDAKKSYTVYAGPDSRGYPTMGAVSVGDSIFICAFFYDGPGNRMAYVRYPVGSSFKYGYIYY